MKITATFSVAVLFFFKTPPFGTVEKHPIKRPHFDRENQSAVCFYGIF